MVGRYVAVVNLILGLLLTVVTCGVAFENKEGKEAKAKDVKRVNTPELDRCTLEMEGRASKPLRVSSPDLVEHVVRDLRVQREGNTIRAFKVGEEKPQWTAKAPDETELAWLGADDKFIYFSGYKSEKKSEDWRPESPLRVRRLELDSGKWQSDLPVAGKPGPKEAESIQAALTNGARVVVLTATTNDDKGFEGVGQMISYHLSCFKVGEVGLLWSKTIPSAGNKARPGVALLWAAGAPAKVQPNVQPLAWLGDDVVVCAGPVQDLFCLEGSTGKQRWRVERVWEYERSFIGPSVWQHEFVRSGRDNQEKKDKDKQGEKGDKRRSGLQYSIVGGPVVVNIPKGRRDKEDQSIFLAVARGPSLYGEYLSDCLVYELNSDGEPLGLANLPRMIRGGRYRVQKDGVVWACQGGAFVKVAASHHRDLEIGGPGGPDLLCRIDWYRHLASEGPEAWLTAAPAGDPVAFGDPFAFRVCAGGHVIDPDAGVYHFPLSMIDLKTGADRAIVLHVPYKGKLPEPESNFSRSQSAEGKVRWKTLGPYVLAITGLEVEDKRLRVTLGMEEWARTVAFEIEDLQGGKQK
jgi:hypothetical protein